MKVDMFIAQLAEKQHGVVARWQILGAGWNPALIHRRLESGALVRVDRNAYRSRGTAPSPRQAIVAAVLSIGPGGTASHQTAAYLWGLIPRMPRPHHLAIADSRRTTRGHRLHRSTDLGEGHLTQLDGIPVTTVARTVVDLGATASRRMVEVSLDAALRERLVTSGEVAALVDEVGRQGRSGVGVMRELLEARAGWRGRSESELEDEFRRLLARTGLPQPVAQHPLRAANGGVVARLDFAYPEASLAIELDGFRYHSDPAAFVRDRQRQNQILMAGYRILRYTATDLKKSPHRVVAELSAALSS